MANVLRVINILASDIVAECVCAVYLQKQYKTDYADILNVNRLYFILVISASAVKILIKPNCS